MSAQDTMRVSDAERTEVTDRLSQHFSDGRLDEAEFHERVDRAMKAKTRADFAGLFDDLPGGDAFASFPSPGGTASPAMTPPPPNWPTRRRLRHPVLTVVLVVIVVSALAHATLPWFFFGPPWLLIGLIAFLILRRHDRHSHYHRH